MLSRPNLLVLIAAPTMALGTLLIVPNPQPSQLAQSAPRSRQPAARADDGPIYFAQDSSSIGDPNPIYQNGVHSVFYLRNEDGHPLWLTQSRTLANWSRPVEIIPSGAADAADFWVGSGSAVADPQGGYRFYYTGHNPRRKDGEVVMETRARALNGPWRKIPEATFSGRAVYHPSEFRDPFVFWNPEAKRYWMLVTTRQGSEAAIGLYTSPDLTRWTASSPLYRERSQLNLEVPDLFTEGGEWFLLYSDQRDESRSVRYRFAPRSAGNYRVPAFDALDGRAFYAGKSAGPGNKRLLFGWIAHKKQRNDHADFEWGGNLVMHSLRRTRDNTLALSLPEGIRNQFTINRGNLSLNAPRIGSAKLPLLVDVTVKARPGTSFGFRFNNSGPQGDSRMEFDTVKGEASFLYAGEKRNAPTVAFPVSGRGEYRLTLVLDPILGLGIAYINDFRALSFRYYKIGDSDISFYPTKVGIDQLRGAVRLKRAPGP